MTLRYKYVSSGGRTRSFSASKHVYALQFFKEQGVTNWWAHNEGAKAKMESLAVKAKEIPTQNSLYKWKQGDQVIYKTVAKATVLAPAYEIRTDLWRIKVKWNDTYPGVGIKDREGCIEPENLSMVTSTTKVVSYATLDAIDNIKKGIDTLIVSGKTLTAVLDLDRKKIKSVEAFSQTKEGLKTLHEAIKTEAGVTKLAEGMHRDRSALRKVPLSITRTEIMSVKAERGLKTTAEAIQAVKLTKKLAPATEIVLGLAGIYMLVKIIKK